MSIDRLIYDFTEALKDKDSWKYGLKDENIVEVVEILQALIDGYKENKENKINIY